MVSVSEAWKVKQTDRLAPEGFVEIRYWVTDPGVQEEAVVTANNQAYYSSPSLVTQIYEKNPPLYAMLENNIWALDGNMELLPASSFGDTGYVSASVSLANAQAPQPLIITLSFDRVHESILPGLVIVWSKRYGEYATSFRVSAYVEGTLLAEKTITDNRSIECPVEMDIVGYDRIEVEVLAWCLPSHRARCEEIRLGLNETIAKDDLLGFEHSQSVDLLSGALPKNVITFRLDNTDGRWNPENPTGMAQYLLERQELTVRYGLDIDGTIEWIPAGTFYMSEWQTPSNGLEATFVARDLFEFMNVPYVGARTGTLYSIAEAALQQAELPTNEDGSQRYWIDESLKEYRSTYIAEDAEFTIAEVLQLVANAGCCVLYQNRDGILCIEPLKTAYNGYAINRHVSFIHPEYIISKELKAVDVNEGLKVTQNSTKGEVQTVQNPFIQSVNQADAVAGWVVTYLKGRKTLSGEFRADPRLDALDTIAVESKYGTNNAVVVTDLTYTFSGAFRGKYSGRVVEFPPDFWLSGELYSGELL